MPDLAAPPFLVNRTVGVSQARLTCWSSNLMAELPMDRIRLGGTLLVVLVVTLLFGCTRHEIQTKSEVAIAPVEIKPIHITIDINIKVDRALDDFFGDIDKAAGKLK